MRKTQSVLLILTLVICQFTIFQLIPSTVQASTASIFQATSGDAYLGRVGAPGETYESIQEASSANTISSFGSDLYIGQYYSSSMREYCVYRAFLPFNLTILDNTTQIESAVLRLRVKTIQTSGANFTIEVYRPSVFWHKAGNVPSDPAALTDFDREYYDNQTLLGSLETSTITTADTWYNITLTNLDFINYGSTYENSRNTKLILRSNRDSSADAPTGFESISFYTCDDGCAAQLELTYTKNGVPDIFGLVNNVDWAQNMDTLYQGLIFGKITKADIEWAFANYCMTSYYPQSPTETSWQDVLHWAPRLQKLGIENETMIKWALEKSAMLPDGLPRSGSGGPLSGDYFLVYDREYLYGYSYSLSFNFLTSKWNVTTAFNSLNQSWHSCPKFPGGFLYTYDKNRSYSFSNRYYDENAETMSCFLLLYEFGAGNGSLDNALAIWNYVNNNHWSDGSEYNTGYHYNYQASTTQSMYECEAGGFLQVISDLRYTYDSPLENYTRLLNDVENRFLQKRWDSYQWSHRNIGTKYVCTHEWQSNDQTRLKNTVMSWAAIIGVYDLLSSDAKKNATEMLEGYAGYDPAWKLLRNSSASLFNNVTNLFRYSSTDTTYTYDATSLACALSFMLGIIQVNATLAIPIEELHYEYQYNILDPELFRVDCINHKVIVSIYTPGFLEFIFNKTVYQEFTQSGVYLLSFASDWDSISSIVRTGDLPSQRKYLGDLDFLAPAYYANTIRANSSEPSETCQFTCDWTDNKELGSFILSHNNTGSIVNETAVAFADLGDGNTWSNKTVVLNETAGNTIQWKFYASDKSGNWNDSMPWQQISLSSNLVPGWNNVGIWNTDVGHTLKEICFSIRNDSIEATSIIKNNGTEYRYDYGGLTNANVPVSSSDSLNVYSSNSGTWYHTYPIDEWERIYLEGFPTVGLADYNGELYAASGHTLYVRNAGDWTTIEAPAYITSIKPYEYGLILGCEGGLYSFNGTTFKLLFTIPTYIRILGTHDNTLYAGTFLEAHPTLYSCNGSADDPSNWHPDAGFQSILNFSGLLGGIDSFTEYKDRLYVTSQGTVYCYDGIEWSVAANYDDVYTFTAIATYEGRLYLATRDQGWRKPMHEGNSGFCGRVIEFDGNVWATVFEHDYWIFALETYNDRLYAGTANRIYTFNGASWDISLSLGEDACYAISLASLSSGLYAGMGNGQVFAMR